MVALRDSNYKINANICSVSQGTVPSKRDVPGRETEAEVGVGLDWVACSQCVSLCCFCWVIRVVETLDGLAYSCT